MSLKDELKDKVAEIFKEQWTKRNGQVIPSSDDLKLSNDAVLLNGVVLYADMSESTKLVNDYNDYVAAEVYKSFLHCAAKIIRNEGGVITSYDGDRIMAVYIGNSKNTSAAKTALKINYARIHIINPALKKQYGNSAYQIKHTVGIDNSELFVARTGIRGSNDLVWVGNAANNAAKLNSLPNTHPSWITGDVYDCLHKTAKFSNDKPMWEKRTWNNMNNKRVYRSSWWWNIT